MYRFSAVLEGNVVAVHVGRQEDLGVPHEPLAGGEVGDLIHCQSMFCRGVGKRQEQRQIRVTYQPRLAIVADIDGRAFLLRDGRAYRPRVSNRTSSMGWVLGVPSRSEIVIVVMIGVAAACPLLTTGMQHTE